MAKFADYLYQNEAGNVRLKIFKHGGRYGGWDYDAFLITGQRKTYSEDVGDIFQRKRDALADAESKYGKMRSIAASHATEGWVTG